MDFKEGWQTKVYIYDNYVIKKKKSRKEIRKTVMKYLQILNKSNELDERVQDMIHDRRESINLIKKSNIPLKIFGNPVFLENGNIKQKRAVIVEDKLIELLKEEKIKEIRNLIEGAVKFFTLLWKYGIHEKTFKIYSNVGIINGSFVLTDFLELTGNKKIAERQIMKRPWYKYRERNRKYGRYPEEFIEYYIKFADKYWTLDNLDKLWGIKIK